MVLDGVLVILSLWIAFAIRPRLGPLWVLIKELPAPPQIPIYAYFLIGFLWVAVFLANNQYDPEQSLMAIDEVNQVFVNGIVAAVLTAGLIYIFKWDISRVLFLTFVLLAILLTILERAIYRIAFRKSKIKPVEARNVLIAGAGPVGLKMKDIVKHYSELGYIFSGFIDDDPELRQHRDDVLGTIDDVRGIIEEKMIDHIVIALPSRAYDRISQLVDQLHTLPVRVWAIPDYFSLTLSKAKILDFAGYPMIDLRAPALTNFQRIVKRIFDLLLSVPMVLLLSPLLLVIIILIKLDSRGPAFYISKRIKENGEFFGMIKFRTMHLDADKQLEQVQRENEDGHLVHKLPDDPRITRIGKILRKTSLDELPQLFNVIRGDMSLVGPRPELPQLVDQYELWQRGRFSVPQGMTGWCGR